MLANAHFSHLPNAVLFGAISTVLQGIRAFPRQHRSRLIIYVHRKELVKRRSLPVQQQELGSLPLRQQEFEA